MSSGKRQRKPMARYLSWYGLKMLTASRERQMSSSTSNDASHKVCDWLIQSADNNTQAVHVDGSHIASSESVIQPRPAKYDEHKT